jgi:uncharacterized protein (TIGR03435 family)
MIVVLRSTIFAALAVSLAYGQGAKRLEFEVASIKPSLPPGSGPGRFGIEGGPGTRDPGRLTGSHATLSFLLTYAYDVRRNQLSGVQEWMDRDMFDFAANVPEGATKEQVKAMLQNLLIDRFKLAVHRETKEVPIYALVVAKGGSKLKPAETPPAASASPKEGAQPVGPARFHMGADGCPDGVPMRAAAGDTRQGYMLFINGRACLIAMNQTTNWVAEMLAPHIGRQVVDMTGLEGEYAFRLRFDPGGRVMTGPVAPPPPGGGDGAARVPTPDADQFPDIFTAVQEQLGLKLESRKGPVDLLVIDHLEKTPTEN